MTQPFMQLDIVSAEALIFSGRVTLLEATGQMGELGIHPGHTALLTLLKPGQIRAVLATDQLTDHVDEVWYISGGFLEVQPNKVTVLADSAQRADDLDEAAALAAQDEAARKLASQKTGIEYTRALSELAEAVAQLRTIDSLRRKKSRS